MTISLSLLPVRVIGIMKERDTANLSDDLNDRIIMPITTVSKRLLNDEKYVANLWFRTKGDIDSAIKSVRALLRINHKIPEKLPDDFRIITSKEMLQQMKLLSNNLYFIFRWRRNYCAYCRWLYHSKSNISKHKATSKRHWYKECLWSNKKRYCGLFSLPKKCL